MDWSVEAIERLKALWAEGHSTAEIGRRMGISKNAVVGKAHRLKDDTNGTLTKYQNGDGIDNKLSLRTGSDVKYFLQDHLGSTIGLTDQSGASTVSQSYYSFGHGTNANFPTRFQFTGREFDPFPGLQFSRARWYHPGIGRFISEDPIGFAGGDVNLNVYVKNRPLKYRDPRGLDDADREWENRSRPRGPDYNPWYWSHNESADNSIFSKPSPSGGRWSYSFGCPGSGLGFGAFSDFSNNYSDMRTANTIGADKFFHCMANCQAAQRGSLGSGIARVVSEGREFFDQYAKGDSQAECDADRFANGTGLSGGQSGRPCVQVWSQFRPTGLSFPVTRPQRDPCQGFGNWNCK
ncbi:hypothetical protein J4558_25925 [Leptolyngbya sp. 15MV]|nr:hypothetical protein J4558_25925 [Leptolyngbya sp. 15MV]